MSAARPIVLVTGVGRRVSIGTEICRRLASDGWDVAFTGFSPEAGSRPRSRPSCAPQAPAC